MPTVTRHRIVRFFAWFAMAKFTAGAFVVVQDRDGLVALTKPRRFRDQWSLPGGFMRRKESPDEALRRECEEEVGLELQDNLLLFATYRQAKSQHFDHLYFMRLSESQPPLKRRRRFWNFVEVGDVGWFDITDRDSRPRLAPETEVALNRIANELGLVL